LLPYAPSLSTRDFRTHPCGSEHDRNCGKNDWEAGTESRHSPSGCHGGQAFFFEEWADQAAVDAHLKTPYFQEFMKQIPELIQGPPNIRMYEVAKSRDL
jgi:hypothetical protein